MAQKCQHCGHAPDQLITRSVCVDHPGHPVSAVCTLTHCQHSKLEQTFQSLEGFCLISEETGKETTSSFVAGVRWAIKNIKEQS